MIEDSMRQMHMMSPFLFFCGHEPLDFVLDESDWNFRLLIETRFRCCSIKRVTKSEQLSFRL